MEASAARSALARAGASRLSDGASRVREAPRREIGEVRCAAGWSHTLRDQPLDVRILRVVHAGFLGGQAHLGDAHDRRVEDARRALVVKREHAAHEAFVRVVVLECAVPNGVLSSTRSGSTSQMTDAITSSRVAKRRGCGRAR